MRRLSLVSIVSLLFLFVSMGVVRGQIEWEKGENRIPNSDFEEDKAGLEPLGWTLEDGT